MAWFSILPASISFIETWLIRLFLFLGFVVISPWVLLLIYDAFLYLFRMATYEIPYIGGRARNRPRPRAPSITERRNGKKRNIGLTTHPAAVVEAVVEAVEDKADGLKKRTNKKSEENPRNVSWET